MGVLPMLTPPQSPTLADPMLVTEEQPRTEELVKLILSEPPPPLTGKDYEEVKPSLNDQSSQDVSFSPPDVSFSPPYETNLDKIIVSTARYIIVIVVVMYCYCLFYHPNFDDSQVWASLP